MVTGWNSVALAHWSESESRWRYDGVQRASIEPWVDGVVVV